MQTVGQVMRYVSIAAMAFAICILGYVVLVDGMLVGSKPFSTVYSQILLRSVADVSGKVVIVGGSSSDHGLDAAKLSREFERLVVNAAENGDVPLLHYLRSVEDVLKRGDTLVLPLEWPYYTRNSRVNSSYVTSVIRFDGPMKTIYAAQPLIDRIQFILADTPISLVVPEVLRKLTGSGEELVGMNKTITEARLLHGESLSTRLGTVEVGRVGAPAWDDIMKLNGCNKFVFSVDRPTDVHLSDSFREAVHWLSEHVQSKGVQVLFAWPPVADPEVDHCYSGEWRPAAQRLAQNIRKLLYRYGMTIVGNWAEWHYPRSCRLDSSYHLVEECRNQHTKRVANALRTGGLVTGNRMPKTEQIHHVLEESIEQLVETARQRLVPLDVDMHGPLATARVLLVHGWNTPEEWGVWSNGNHSVFVASLPPPTMEGLHIKGEYYGSPERTRVRINGVDVGQFDLRDARVPLAKTGIHQNLRVELFHKEPGNPPDERNRVFRKIKYGLKQVAALSQLIDPLPTFIKADEFSRYVLFSRGWSMIEPWGIWSLGNESEFDVKVPQGTRAIVVTGQYFGGVEKTRVHINGRYMGRYDLRNAVISLDESDASSWVRVELLHEHPVAPRDVDPNSQDSRRIKFGLKTIGTVSTVEESSSRMD